MAKATSKSLFQLHFFKTLKPFVQHIVELTASSKHQCIIESKSLGAFLVCIATPLNHKCFGAVQTENQRTKKKKSRPESGIHIFKCAQVGNKGAGEVCLYLTFKKFSSKRQNFCLLFLESIPFITETKNKPISINTRTESDSHINYPY